MENKSPYKGMWAVILALVIFPVFCWFILDAALGRCLPNTPEINAATSQAVGFGLGTLFHLSCFVAGTMTEPFCAVKNRIREFFENLIVSFPFAAKYYLYSLKTDGVVFWIYLLIMTVCAVISADGFIDFFELYGATV